MSRYKLLLLTSNNKFGKNRKNDFALLPFPSVYFIRSVNREKRGENIARPTFPQKTNFEEHKGLNCRRLQDLGAKFVREVTPLTV